MLFSHNGVAGLINERFEPSWEGVRSVPMVSIDFGEGRVVKRTLHGNIATYVCDSQGRVLDVIAGLYQHDIYLIRLNEALELAKTAGTWPAERFGAELAAYHQGRLETMLRIEKLTSLLDVRKARIEVPVKKAIAPPEAARLIDPAKEVTGYTAENALVVDSHYNESVRRKQVHKILATGEPREPSALTKRLYRDVLHTDLDDPYLGLGKVLFQTYPFDK